MNQYQASNQKLWDEWTIINSKSSLYQLEAFRCGTNKLNPLEIKEVGSVNGKKLLHLQCHFGMDTLSWAMLGADVTGVDFSSEAIRLARRLSDEMKINAEFIQANLYDLPQILDKEFDIVYTSYGVLAWIDNLTKWAQVVAKYVARGGIFYIAEFHPFAMVFDDGAHESVWNVRYDYFSKEVLSFPVEGSYADRNANVQQKISYEWQHTLGDIVSELIMAGLQIEFLHEHDTTVYEMFPFLIKEGEGSWKIPGELKKLPLMFSIRAKKE